MDKVKELFLIPKLNMMTTKQVADYYEVDYDVIRMSYQRNKIEIETDGSPLITPKSLKVHYVPTKIEHGKCIFTVTDAITLEVPNRGIRCFSKRAIHRIGMLLRDYKNFMFGLNVQPKQLPCRGAGFEFDIANGIKFVIPCGF